MSEKFSNKEEAIATMLTQMLEIKQLEVQHGLLYKVLYNNVTTKLLKKLHSHESDSMLEKDGAQNEQGPKSQQFGNFSDELDMKMKSHCERKTKSKQMLADILEKRKKEAAKYFAEKLQNCEKSAEAIIEDFRKIADELWDEHLELTLSMDTIMHELEHKLEKYELEIVMLKCKVATLQSQKDSFHEVLGTVEFEDKLEQDENAPTVSQAAKKAKYDETNMENAN